MGIAALVNTALSVCMGATCSLQPGFACLALTEAAGRVCRSVYVTWVFPMTHQVLFSRIICCAAVQSSALGRLMLVFRGTRDSLETEVPLHEDICVRLRDR